MKFKNFEKQVINQFVIYCDFETLLVDNINIINEKDKNVKKIHKPIAFYCFTVYRSNDNYNRKYSYFGINSARRHVEYIKDELIRISEILSDIKPIFMDENSVKNFEAAENCYICNEPFTEENFKVKDHDHVNGKYRGAAHNRCNVTYLRQKRYLPIAFHNLENYDSHLFIKELNNIATVQILAKSKEKFFTITSDFQDRACFLKARFIDSYLFLHYSLKELSYSLKEFKCNTNPNLYGKQVFPYEYCSSVKKLESKYIANKNDFYNSITHDMISDEDYNHFCQIYDSYHCENLKDYMFLYLEVDVLLLADIFENFRNTIIKDYNLDPTNYLTIPSLTWDACLKFTKIKLELINNIDILNMFSHGIRGGVSTVSSLKYATANNHYMKDFKANEKESYIIYLDANNLYGLSMCQPLSIGNFMFRNDLLDDLNLEKIKEITKNNIYNIDTKRTIKQTNFILEVDLDYPKNLHDLHNDFSFAPEHLQSRLIPNLYNKNKYILHFRNLEFYIDNGLILKKIHRVLQFTESNWMKGYIMFNTNKRMKSDNKFEKCLYKLMNNFIYGKSIGNVRKRVSFRLVNSDKKAINLCSKPNYKRYIELDKNNHIIKLSKLSSFMINQSIWECVY